MTHFRLFSNLCIMQKKNGFKGLERNCKRWDIFILMLVKYVMVKLMVTSQFRRGFHTFCCSDGFHRGKRKKPTQCRMKFKVMEPEVLEEEATKYYIRPCAHKIIFLILEVGLPETPHMKMKINK